METGISVKLRPSRIKKLIVAYQDSRNNYCLLKETIPLFFSQIGTPSAPKRVLIASIGSYDARTEALYACALKISGYKPYVICRWDPFVKKIFRLFGIKDVFFYNSYYRKFPLRFYYSKAEAIVNRHSPQSILEFNDEGVYVGKYAASSFMRMTRRSSFDFSDSGQRLLFIERLARALRAKDIAEALISQIKPELLFVNDRGYTPEGELFDKCLASGIHVIQRCGSHKSGSEILKRYTSASMSRIHHHSLSQKSWEYIKDLPWNDSMWHKLYGEIEHTYGSGDWFSEVGTQFNKKMYTPNDLTRKLGIDPGKKTALVFPHIFWDATFFWGKDLFADYYDWFVNVLKVANANDHCNWVIKIHPANIIKAKRDNYRGQPQELTAVHETIHSLPKHIKVLPPETDINTFSLFSISDYCLTVRGTVGIEAAMLGIVTLTAGTGRYDRLGFTYDFDSKNEYLDCLANIQEIRSMSDDRIALARRFAYGLFLMRPFVFDVACRRHLQDAKASIEFWFNSKTKQSFENSYFVQALSEFISSGDEDFIDKRLACLGES